MTTKDEIESLIDWWRRAGADTIVADRPSSWFEARPAKPQPRAAQPPAETRTGPVMPDTLEAFRDWWRDHDFAGAPQTDRVAPEGDPASGLMVLLDMPEPGDAEAGRLASGDVGLLLDRMLAAIGRDRASIYLAGLCPAAMPGGSLAEDRIEPLAEAARRHIALAAPKLLLLMGEATSRALCGSPPARLDDRPVAARRRAAQRAASCRPRRALSRRRIAAGRTRSAGHADHRSARSSQRRSAASSRRKPRARKPAFDPHAAAIAHPARPLAPGAAARRFA
ncbi:MAG: uracil-DNA glycosylase [Sphingomonadales bacterium]|nr:uracil-DNA glycosylase [Sphingomonadales bacterium]